MQVEQTDEALRRTRLKQLFGDNFRGGDEAELALSRPVQQDPQPEPEPEWTEPALPGERTLEWGARRLTAWLLDKGVNLDSVIVLEGADTRRLALVTARAVPAGTVLFDVPDRLLLTADVALADPNVGRSLRIMAAKTEPSEGFDTFCIATLLAAERVRRGAVAARLRRVEGSGGLKRVMSAPLEERLLPRRQAEAQAELQRNSEFSPLIGSLEWPREDECVVDADRAGAIEGGAELIARLIEPCARNAWTTAAGASGLIAPPTSAEDTLCAATQALLVAMSQQQLPPPPVGAPGEARWGGNTRAGPALCPLVNLVVLPDATAADAARAAGAFNARLGRPPSDAAEAAGTAIRCVAATDLPAGAVILADDPSMVAAAPAPPAEAVAAGDRVRVVQGRLEGQVGTVLKLRAEDQRPIVRLDGEERKLVVVPPGMLAATDDGE